MRMFFKIVLITCLTVSCFEGSAQQLATESKEVKLMGCRFVFRVVADDKDTAWKAINAGIDEISRIEKLISSWGPNSQTSEINNNAGIQSVEVTQELFDLIKRSAKISELTHGAFDISFASMVKITFLD